jgi:hypothetical protein
MDEQEGMQELILELRKTLTLVTHQPPMMVHPDDDATPRATITILAEMICAVSEDMYLRSLVGSVFESQSIENVYRKVKEWNKVRMPEGL